MNSSDFRDLTGPLTTSLDRGPRKMKRGGKAKKPPHHLTIVMIAPIGAPIGALSRPGISRQRPPGARGHA